MAISMIEKIDIAIEIDIAIKKSTAVIDWP
jgi:hypothetical protein